MTHHILIADDDPHICQTLTPNLSLEGVAAKSVFTGKLALQEIENNQPAILILDKNMPEVDGIKIITVGKVN